MALPIIIEIVYVQGLGAYSSVVEHLADMCMVFGSIPSTGRKKMCLFDLIPKGKNSEGEKDVSVLESSINYHYNGTHFSLLYSDLKLAPVEQMFP